MTVRGVLRLILVFSLFVAWTLICLPLQLIGLFLYRPLARQLPVIYHRVLARLIGVRITRDGSLPHARPLLIVSNHVTWLDIVVLSSIGPVSFVAKSEMAKWPIFGQLARLQRTIFVRREDRRRSGEQANTIARRLQQKDIIVLFPEGTTGDGHRLYPFKPTLFEAARYAVVASEVEHALVQPVAVHYTHLHGLPLGRQRRHHFAWPGDIGLAENLLPLIATGALDVCVRLGQPIPLDASSNRKEIAAKARGSIRRMLRRDILDSPLTRL